MKKNFDEQFDLINVIPNLIAENADYIMETIYEFETENGISRIMECENLFEDVSQQYICLKIVHNLSMMGSFMKNYITETGASCNSVLSKNKKLYVKFSISSENVDIIKKKGFGIFGYNSDDFAHCLFEFSYAFENYLKSKAEEYEFLNIVLKDWLSYSYVDPNTAMTNLIKNNKDFFTKK